MNGNIEIINLLLNTPGVDQELEPILLNYFFIYLVHHIKYLNEIWHEKI